MRQRIIAECLRRLLRSFDNFLMQVLNAVKRISEATEIFFVQTDCQRIYRKVAP
jgi:hypothetical protein